MTSQYLTSSYPLNCLPVFFKSTLQVPWMEGAAGLGQVFKRCTGHGTTDSAVLVACIKPHRLSEGGPKEIIFEFNQMPTSVVVEAIWDKPPFFRHQPAFRFPDCLPTFSAALPFFSAGRSC
jgi:hypothetical protein